MSFVGSGLGGADVHAAVDRHGVHGDDFGVELLRLAAEADRGFARGGWAGEDQGIRKWLGENHDTLLGDVLFSLYVQSSLGAICLVRPKLGKMACVSVKTALSPDLFTPKGLHPKAQGRRFGRTLGQCAQRATTPKGFNQVAICAAGFGSNGIIATFGAELIEPLRGSRSLCALTQGAPKAATLGFFWEMKPLRGKEIWTQCLRFHRNAGHFPSF